MNLATTINTADTVLRTAAQYHAQGESEKSLAAMMDLRKLLNEPIVADNGEPGQTDASTENLSQQTEA